MTRTGVIGVELVYHGDRTSLNFFTNGIQHSSRTIYKEITIPEALILLATEVRMGYIEINPT